jgi:ABC-2 type transport system permease protein
MRVYWEIARRTFRRYAAYRGATVAGVFTNAVFGYILANVMEAALQDGRTVNGMDAQQAVTFSFVSQSLLMVVAAFGDKELALRVTSGEIATDLFRPVGLSGYKLAQDLGRGAYYIVARGVPPFLLGAIGFHLSLPNSPGAAFGFVVAVVLAAILASRFWLIFNLAAFWLVEGNGVAALGSGLIMFGSGALIPLQFMPDGLAVIVRATPMACLVQLPIEVWLGRQSGPEVWLIQLLWISVLHLLGHDILRRATRKLEIQGG